MLEIPSREAFAQLLAEAGAIVQPITLGFTRPIDDTRVSIAYTTPMGIGEYVLPAAELPELVRPATEGVRETDLASLQANPQSVFEWHLLVGQVRRAVSFKITSELPTRFWVGMAGPDPCTPEQLKRLDDLAQSSADLLRSSITPEEAVERLRRLDLAAELLPALQVLDLREIFNRVSAIAQKALPHDLLMLRLLNEDLSKIQTFARTGGGKDLDISLRHAYPATVTRAWNFDILDDHSIHPVEKDQPAAKFGIRSSLRLPIRFNNQLLAGFAFMSFQPGRYTTEDVVVALRLADHVAITLAHYNLAERLAAEARNAEALQARATSLELLDELLASQTEARELPVVLTRISTIMQKVLPHDAAVLVTRSTEGSARVCVSGEASGDPQKNWSGLEGFAQDSDQDDEIVDDLSLVKEPRFAELAKRKFRSLLRVPVHIEEQFAGTLIFLSNDSAAFSQPDVLAARRSADRIAVTLVRDREAAAARRADEATERAARLEARVRELTEELDARTGYRRVVGESAEWRQVLKQATQVAPTEATVLLLGESGTGKEVIARFVHRASSRNNGPFVALNCAALPEQLLEAELFGYERGAFTGAMQSKPGQLEQAAGGTLFLDEVGEMSPPAQAKFLRVLQEREFQRLGGTRVLRTDARVVAATNRDLLRSISQGQFREDLYYRLNVFAIKLPALRNRKDDILALSEAFMTEIGRSIGRPPSGISRDARQMLLDYHWPGNVRELRNILERAAILCDGGLITADHLALNVTAAPAPAPPPPPAPATPAAAEPAAASAKAGAGVPDSAADLQSMERTMIEQALEKARFNKSKAAKALGLTRHQLYVRMRKYGFE